MTAHILIALGSLVLMEPLVALTHRYVMHGIGWRWHESHHRPGRRHLKWEVNDLYAVIAMLACLLLFTFSSRDSAWWWVGLGVTAYGLLYAIVHDGLVHRRFPLSWQVRHPYLKRLIDAHHLHHATDGKDGAVSYGFLYAPPLDALRARLKASRRG